MPRGKRLPGAVVLGGNYRALAVVQSLGRHGVPVWVAPTDGYALAGRSRYAQRILPWEGVAGERLADALVSLNAAAAGWVLIPTDDDDTELVSRHHAVLAEHFAMTVSPWERLASAADKRRSYALAAELGVPHPRLWPVHGDRPEVAPEGFPVVIKPTSRPRVIAATSPKAWPVADADELGARWKEARELFAAEDLLVQAAVPGGGEGQLAYGTLCRDGEVLASIGARRTRQRPMDFGQASTYVESVDDTAFAGFARRWIAAARLTGLVEVEFKRAPGGPPRLLDVNPRAWGWISLGARAGVDFPWLLWRMATGEPVTAPAARRGVGWMRPVTDVPTAVGEVVGRRLGAGEYLASWRPPIDLATLTLDDPAPGLLEPLVVGRMALRRRRRARTTPPDGGRRVLILLENAPVPQDRRVWNEATTLRDAGWDVTVIAPGQQRSPQPRTERLEGIAVHRYPLRASGGGLTGWVREYAVAMWEIRRLVAALAREAPFDVIHASNPPDFLLAAALPERRRGTALVFDQHDLVPEMAEERFTRGLAGLRAALVRAERFAYAAGDVTLAMNESFRAIAIERGRLAHEDVVVVRNGPRLARFVPQPADPALRRGRDHLIVYVGLMNPLDGVDHALHALAALRRRRDDWHAILLGDGEAHDELQALAVELGIGDRVEFPGFVDDLTLRRAICSADVCLAPDPRSPLTEASTMVKIAEYMAMGRPIVTYDLRETRVTAGPAALYADGDEPAALADGLDRLLADPALRGEMGRLARERVVQRFAWEHSEPALLGAYERAMAKAARRCGRAAPTPRRPPALPDDPGAMRSEPYPLEAGP